MFCSKKYIIKKGTKNKSNIAVHIFFYQKYLFMIIVKRKFIGEHAQDTSGMKVENERNRNVRI